MDPLSIAASVLTLYQVAVQVGAVCFRYAAAVKRGESETDKFLQEIRTFMTSLCELEELLRHEKQQDTIEGERLESLKALLSGEPNILTSCKEELEKLEIKLQGPENPDGTHSKAKTIFQRLKWPLKQEDVKRLIDNMRHVSLLVEQAKTRDQLMLSLDLDTRTRNIDATTKAIQSTARDTNILTKEMVQMATETKEAKEIRKLAKDRDDFLSWLQQPDENEIHNLALGARHKNADTGRWLVQDERYSKFNGSRHGIIWLHGHPGAGKTTLAATLIEDIRKRAEQDRKTILGFWYFSTSDKATTGVEDCFKSILGQLVRCFSGRLPQAIQDFWARRYEHQTRPRISDIREPLQRMILEENLMFYLVIDGLDEVRDEDLEELLSFLQSLTTANESEIRILLVSRTPVKDAHAHRFRDPAEFYDFPIQRECTDIDIEIHITETLRTDSKLGIWPKETREKILKKLLNGAEGMFRWVDCQLSALRRCNQQSAIEKTLKRLPKDLHEQYSRDLARVPEEDEMMITSILKWLVFPQRKIRLDEVAEIAAFCLEEGEVEYNRDDKLKNPNMIFDLCGSLIRKDESTQGTNHLGDSVKGVNYLTTAHSTVIDFLTSGEIKVGDLKPMRFSRANINYEMAMGCLVYLKSLFRYEPVLNEFVIQDYRLARLSAQFYDDFMRELMRESSETRTIDPLNRLVIELMASKETLLKLIQLCDPDNGSRRVDFNLTEEEIHSPLYYASLLGLPDVVQHFIDVGDNVNYTSRKGFGTPLTAAAALGRSKCVEILLEAGADPALSGCHLWGRPLAAAVQNNHIDIINILLETASAEVNCRRHTEETEQSPLELELKDIVAGNSAGKGNGTEQNDNYDVSAHRYRSTESMVYIAVSSNSLEALEILLNHGADVNLTGGQWHTPLAAACSLARTDLVDKLLRHNASPTIYGGAADNVLIAACKQREAPLEMFRKLVGKNVNVNRRDSVGCTSLHHAACNQRPETVRLLIDEGGDVNARGGGLDDSPLQTACFYGRTENARILLERGSDPNLQGAGYSDNNLMAAVSGGEHEIVKMILDAGVSPNTRGGKREYPLIAAFCGKLSQRMEIVKLLLQAGADPDVVISEGQHKQLSPVVGACSVSYTHEERFELLNLLLDHGANVNAPEPDNYTAAFERVLSVGDYVSMKLLLDRGLNIRKHTRRGYRLTKAISCHIDLETLKDLLGYCDINAMDNTFPGNALHATVIHRRFAQMDALVEAGADPELLHWYSGSIIGTAIEGIEGIDMLDKVYGLVKDKNSTNMIGQNPLLLALKLFASENLIQHLLTLGYNTAFTDKRGCNALHYLAVKSWNTKILGSRTCKGLDVNCRDKNGWTPLHYAAAGYMESIETIDALLEAGANRDLRDKWGYAPLEIAYGFNRPHAFELLRGKRIPQELLFKIENLDTAIWRYWVNLFCQACGNRGGKRYSCQECFKKFQMNYDLCAFCWEQRHEIHFEDHNFDIHNGDFWRSMPPEIERPELDGTGPIEFICDLKEKQHFKLEDNAYYFGLTERVELHSDTHIVVRGDAPFRMRPFYYEVTILGCIDWENRMVAEFIFGLGLATSEVARGHTGMPGWARGSWGYHSDDGCYFNGNSECIVYNKQFDIGDTVGCGIDPFVYEFDEECVAIFFTLNGRHLGAFPIVERGLLWPVIATQHVNVKFEANFGQNEFVWKGEKYRPEEAVK